MNAKLIRRENVRRMCRTALLAAAAVLLGACGGGPSIEGRYDGVRGDSLLESLTLGSDGAASVVYPLGLGSSGAASYTFDGETVVVTVPGGQQARFEIDANGCLTHFMLGTLCRGAGGSSGGAGAFGASGAFGGGAATAASGGAERYEATMPEGLVLLELLPGGTARMTMTPFGGGGGDMPQRLSFDLSYETRGDRIAIEMPGEGPTELTRSGRDLLMTVDGETARFIRQ